MKKLFTLFTLLVGVTVQAQTESPATLRSELSGRRATIARHPKLLNSHSSSRSSSVPFSLDYVSSDNYYSTVQGYTQTGYIWDVNSHFGNADNLTLDYYTVKFDSLLINTSSDGSSIDGSTFIPTASATLTLDSFDVWCQHTHTNTSVTDTLTITVYNTATLNQTGSGASGALTQTSVWDTTLFLTASIPADPTATPWSILSFHPNLPFAQGETFGIRVDYASTDTANHFYTGATYNDACNAQYGAIPSVVPDNTLYYVNYTAAAPTGNLSGINTIGIGSPSTTQCYEFFVQNAYIFPYVTATVEYGVTIVADKTAGCTNDVINLSANLYGTDATDAVPTWSILSGDGTLGNTDQSDNTLTLGASSTTVVLSVTSTDGTVADTLTFSVKSINVAFNSSPYTIACAEGNSSATLTPSVTGVTTGRTNSWSSGPTTSTTTANLPGTYTLTVTNSFGCTASAAAVVQYPNGVNNNVGFTTPTGNLCINQPYTFQNTSSSTDGWSAKWITGGDTTNIDQVYDFNYTFTTSGTKVIKLIMDSADCIFSVSKTKSATTCTGIEDVSFSNSISLMPNPTSANVTVEVANVEKNVSVVFYNILGATVKSFSAETNGQFSQTFNVSDFATGTYIVRIASGNNVATKRLVVAGK